MSSPLGGAPVRPQQDRPARDAGMWTSCLLPGGGSPIWVAYCSKASSKPLTPASPDPEPLPQLNPRPWGQRHSASQAFWKPFYVADPSQAPGHWEGTADLLLTPGSTPCRAQRDGSKDCTANVKWGGGEGTLRCCVRPKAVGGRSAGLGGGEEGVGEGCSAAMIQALRPEA